MWEILNTQTFYKLHMQVI